MNARVAHEPTKRESIGGAAGPRCAFCARPALQTIPSNTGRVCPAHALEFWTGLLAYATDRPDHVSLAR